VPIRRASERLERPSALEVFTNREGLIDAFQRALEQKRPDQHRVLVFYGDGGIGKSLLTRKLEQLLRQRDPEALLARLDFAGNETTPPDVLLYRLRRAFPTLPFPSFSLGLAIYAKRVHPEQPFPSDRAAFLEGTGPYGDLLSDALGALTSNPAIAVAISTLKATAQARRQVREWFEGRAEPWLRRSTAFSEEELLAQLPLLWAQDFRHALRSRAARVDLDWDDQELYNGPPPLIVLDTYEALWHPGRGRRGELRSLREQWLVDLISELPEVLWLIGGRDRISWEEAYDPGWSEVCEQHLVGRLSDADARAFLAKRQVSDPQIVERILETAAGIPFYLELQSQLHERIEP
ncbi:MAG: hypothetical protein VKI81_11240, partial [Synechococcaceae cyanobacterium]|nr:hypothetical protein [Synechococcaceae cyanobacterium]